MGKASGGLMTVVTGKVAGAVGYRLQNSKAPQGWREYRGEISNPKTKGQRVQRARFATVVQAAAFLSQIIDHSFEGVTGATANRGRFIKENLAIMKPRIADFLLKGEHRVACNPFLISNGTLPTLDIIQANSGGVYASMALGTPATATPAEIFPDYAPGTQFTIVALRCPKNSTETGETGGTFLSRYSKTFVDIARFTLNPDANVPAFIAKDQSAGTYQLNEAAVNQELSLNWRNLTFFLSSGGMLVSFNNWNDTNDNIYGGTIIASQRTGASYKYSRQTLYVPEGTGEYYYGNTLEQAQATYDVGGAGDVYASQKYLNNADNA